MFNSIKLLIKNDFYLLEIGANERSVAHKLAEYLQQEFPNWHVDCEYNRHGERIKKLDKDYVYPDIKIHLRNTDFNLLVTELKCSCDKSEKDIYKLKKFTYHEDKFKYKLGLFLKIDKEGIKEMIWF